MGLRGRLPKLKVKDADLLDCKDCPEVLQGEAQTFWENHVDFLDANGLLTRQTLETFILVCELWAATRTLKADPKHYRAFLDTLKAFQQLAKFFRLLPIDKPGKNATDRFEDKDEFEF